MNALYIEAFSGVSGDMLNGLLLDLSDEKDYLLQELKKLGLKDYQISVKKIAKSSIYGTDFDVILSHGQKDLGIPHEFDHEQASEAAHHHEHELNDHHQTSHEHINHSHQHTRGLKDIQKIIQNSQLSDFVKEHSLNVFKDIAIAEASVHQRDMYEIHFHEVGAVDSIVDIVSFFILVEKIGIDHFYSSPITEGSGTIEVAHGILPVPVPAVMALRKGTNIPIVQDMEVKTELVTPTGLALIKEIAPTFGTPPQNWLLEKLGYGFGKRETGKFNGLRGSIFKNIPSDKVVHSTEDEVLKIEANIDDQDSEQLGFVMDLLLDNGVLDVFYTPIHMKKNRVGILLTVLVEENQKALITDILFRQTKTIGIRYCKMARKVMKRQFEILQTPLGDVRVKTATYKDIKKEKIEFEDCEKITKQTNLSILEVYKEINKILNNIEKGN